MTKPKVLILGKLSPPDVGSAIATKILLNSNLRNRLRLIHLDTSTNDDLSGTGNVGMKKVLRNVGIYRKMWKVLKAEKPELVLVPISQNTVGFIKDSLYIHLAKMAGVPVMLQLRGSNIRNWLSGANRHLQKYADSVFRKSNGVIVLGECLRYLFEPWFPLERIYVVPNGGNYTFPEVSRNNGTMEVQWVGSLPASKGIEDVLQAVSLLKERGVENFRLQVLGGWREEEVRQKALALVEQEQLPVESLPPGESENNMRYLAEADIFVFTPRKPEGHPWVIVEAIAAGLPIITTDQGAIRESVLEGQNGFLVETRSPKAIADRLQVLIEEPEVRQRMGENSRGHYQINFTEERMVRRMEQAFKDLLAQTRL